MADSYLGEIRPFAGNFAPYQWALCNGQLLPIQQNTPLFALLGTTFGGDGRVTFGLPNFQGRAAMNQGDGPGLTPRECGDDVGSATVTLTEAAIPAHTHPIAADDAGNVATPANGIPGAFPGRGIQPQPYASGASPNIALAPAAIAPVGGGQPHNNRSPYLAVNYIISLYGEFPSFP